MSSGLRIAEFPTQERPRERLERLGSSSLSEAELIAILLRTGIPGANAVDLAAQLLAKFKNLRTLSRCTVKEIASVKGVGKTKATQLAAAFGLGERLAREYASELKVDSPQAVEALLGEELRALHQESLRVILLNTRYNLIRTEEVSRGSINESIAHPREIFRPAIHHSAYAIIVAHNHPSGDPSPSEADHRLTRRLAEASSLLQIRLLDHVILGQATENRPGYFSFKEAGIL